MKSHSVACFRYDAFGNCEIVTNINNIAEINPIRYRSYYYDAETNLYYLQTRYYDPEVGRFISPDSIKYLEPETINGLNLYAYCLNNPVMRIDPTGCSWDWGAIGRALGGAVIAIAGLSLTIATSRLAFIPFASFIPQFGVSMAMYGGYMVASAFDSQIYQDMSAIGWNPFNSDENAVMSSGSVSFYKGQAVIKGNFPGCMSYGIMFVDNGPWVTADTIRHEYGHFLQMGILGVPKFTLGIAVPSLIGTQVTPSNLYHSQPWEVTADILGGAKRFSHVKGSELLGWIYFTFLFWI